MMRKNVWTYEEMISSNIMMCKMVALILFEKNRLNHYKTRILSLFYHLNFTAFGIIYTGYGIRMVMHQKIEIDYICEHVEITKQHLCYLLLYSKREKLLLKLLKTCREIWSLLTSKEFNIIIDYEKKALYFKNFIILNCIMCGFLFLVPGSTEITSTAGNIIKSKEPPYKFFMEINDESQYKMVLTLDWVAIFNIALIACETMATHLVLLPCDFLKVLKHRILMMTKLKKNGELNNDENKNVETMNYNDIKVFIKFHQKIMLYCKEFEKFMCNIYFVTVFAAVYNMSITGLRILENSDAMKYESLFMINLFQLFNYQWGPEYLLTESTAIGKAAYFSKFNKVYHQKNISYALCFMMMRAQKPVQMTAGGYIKLSMEYFESMLKSDFSVFTLTLKVN